ncbi:alpha/beta hydrolase-fold protein [Streptomyces uncialis]|uniref:alpha/beta hydrolase-fold protein n=1 Tax=Streptomyces uncialis TaxID=1048205 RepID=UPI003823FA02
MRLGVRPTYERCRAWLSPRAPTDAASFSGPRPDTRHRRHGPCPERRFHQARPPGRGRRRPYRRSGAAVHRARPHRQGPALTPDGWHARRPARRWPTLYLLPGGDGDHLPWTQDYGIQQLPALRHTLVVMPEMPLFGFCSDWWNHGAGGPPAVESFHLREVLPLMEREYGAGPRRAVAGQSQGGFGALSYADPSGRRRQDVRETGSRILRVSTERPTGRVPRGSRLRPAPWAPGGSACSPGRPDRAPQRAGSCPEPPSDHA